MIEEFIRAKKDLELEQRTEKRICEFVQEAKLHLAKVLESDAGYLLLDFTEAVIGLAKEDDEQQMQNNVKRKQTSEEKLMSLYATFKRIDQRLVLKGSCSLILQLIELARSSSQKKQMCRTKEVNNALVHFIQTVKTFPELFNVSSGAQALVQWRRRCVIHS